VIEIWIEVVVVAVVVVVESHDDIYCGDDHRKFALVEIIWLARYVYLNVHLTLHRNHCDDY
jgi:hypothetical protein